MSKIIFIILCSIIAVNAQYSNTTNQVCKQHNQEVIKTLDADNALRLAIERNAAGDGVLQPWIKKMKASKVKHASAVVDFEFQGQALKFSLQTMDFYDRYYYFASDARIKNSRDEEKSLKDELKLPFFNKAMEWIGKFESKNNSCGRLYLHLLDDACLPIIYDTGTVEDLVCSKQ